MEKVINIIESKIQKQRLKDMKEAAKKRKIKISDHYRKDVVTHLVTEFKDIKYVLRKINLQSTAELGETEVVSVEWFADCMRANRVVEVQERHRISATQMQEPAPSRSDERTIPEYACQRATPLEHHNEKFTKALEILEKHAELRDTDQDYSRALAFRRASCVLKSLPAPLQSMHQLRNVVNIGDHSKRVIQEILDNGTCEEVETIRKDSWFQKMQLFSGVFGVGSATAKKWIAKGWSTIEEVQQGITTADWRLQWGLAFHTDLTAPVTRQEADFIYSTVQRHVNKLLPGATLEVTGGFRRGKESGHDVDILITHPDEGREVGLLPRLVQSLQSQDIILCGKLEKSTYADDVLTRDYKLTMKGQLDHFEKWLGIVKVPKGVATKPDNEGVTTLYSRNNGSTASDNVSSFDSSLDETENRVTNENNGHKTAQELSKEPRDWLARRVDLIISPYSQYYYALVGWTGNKMFNRDLRWYAQKKREMKLTSHGLYDLSKGKKLPASSEQEVFDHLQIPYREPAYRNC